MRKSFVGLDVLRFALAVYLMVFHTVQYYPAANRLPLHELLGLGSFATSTFFLLSGFILAHVYFGETALRMRRPARDFFIQRLTNLYPIGMISLLMFAAIVVVSGGSLRTFEPAAMGAAVQPVVLSTGMTWFNAGLSMLLLDTWNPLYVTLNPPAWSLSVLLFFYLCFPLLAPRLLGAGRKMRSLGWIWLAYLIPPAIATAGGWYGPPVAGLVTSNPILRLPEFMAGIVLYGLFREGRLDALTRLRGWRSASLGVVAICFVGAAFLSAHGAPYWGYLLHNGLLMPAEVLLMIVAAYAMNDVPAFWAQWFARLGNAALSIFAIHLALFLAFIKLQRVASAGISPWDCLRAPGACVAAAKTAPLLLSAYPLYLVLTLIAALIFQERVVAKVRGALRRHFSRPALSQPDRTGPGLA